MFLTSHSRSRKEHSYPDSLFFFFCLNLRHILGLSAHSAPSPQRTLSTSRSLCLALFPFGILPVSGPEHEPCEGRDFTVLLTALALLSGTLKAAQKYWLKRWVRASKGHGSPGCACSFDRTLSCTPAPKAQPFPCRKAPQMDKKNY